MECTPRASHRPAARRWIGVALLAWALNPTGVARWPDCRAPAQPSTTVVEQPDGVHHHSGAPVPEREAPDASHRPDCGHPMPAAGCGSATGCANTVVLGEANPVPPPSASPGAAVRLTFGVPAAIGAAPDTPPPRS